MTTRGTSFAKDQSGASAVEFALVGGLLITLVMGIIEFSLILYTYTTADSATRDVARRIATSRLSAASASATLKASLPAWVQSSATVTVTQTTPGTASTNQITVTVTFPARNATPTTYLSFAYQSLNLSTATTMQQEI